MQRLRNRFRADNLTNQQRATATAPWGKRIYLALLAGLAIVALDYAFGDALFLRADGIIVAERHVVAATYSGRVRSVKVKEGDAIAIGALVVEMESGDMLRDIADAAVRTADLAVRETQLRVRRETVASLLPLAERHAKESAEQVSRVDAMTVRGLVNAQFVNQSLTAGYETALKLAELRGQSDTLTAELRLVERSHARAAEALGQLEAFYDRGAVRAPVSGNVGVKVPSPGQVLRFGDEILQINGRDTHVLAYLPDIHLFAVTPGDAVQVKAGASSVRGKVEAILTVADALPAEFQNMFRPRDRSRLVRVSLPEGHGLAVSQKVRVKGCLLSWC